MWYIGNIIILTDMYRQADASVELYPVPEAERMFSALCCIKICFSLTMTQHRLDSCCLLNTCIHCDR